MVIGHDEVNEAVVALMWRTLHDERRTWKNSDRAVTDRLYQKGFIADPANNAQSVVFRGW
jgi:hypothetical protein